MLQLLKLRRSRFLRDLPTHLHLCCLFFTSWASELPEYSLIGPMVVAEKSVTCSGQCWGEKRVKLKNSHRPIPIWSFRACIIIYPPQTQPPPISQFPIIFVLFFKVAEPALSSSASLGFSLRTGIIRGIAWICKLNAVAQTDTYVFLALTIWFTRAITVCPRKPLNCHWLTCW